jgi:hypothetical protein
MENEQSVSRHSQRSDVGVIDSPARAPERAPPPEGSSDDVSTLKEKLAQAEHLSAQSFTIMRRQSAMIRQLKQSEEALLATSQQLGEANAKLMAENGELSTAIVRVTAQEAAKEKHLGEVIERQNALITRLLNLPPNATEAA